MNKFLFGVLAVLSIFLSIGMAHGQTEQQLKSDLQKKLGANAISELLTRKLQAQIKEIDGIRDRGQIQQFVDNMSVMDSGSLRKYINENEPGLDLNVDRKSVV